MTGRRRVVAPVPEMLWADFWPMFARRYHVSPDSADHVTIIGPTKTGKTTLAMEIASLRKYVVALGTKPRDDEFRRLARAGGYRMQRVGDLPSPRLHPRVLVWPEYRGITDRPRQARAFADVFDQAFTRGGWHIVGEEGPHLVDLGLAPRIAQHLRMGRTMSSGLILCAQRPVGFPREARTGAQHLFLFGSNDSDDLRTLGGLNGADTYTVRETVARLGRTFRFLYVGTDDGTLIVSRYDKRKVRK